MKTLRVWMFLFLLLTLTTTALAAEPVVITRQPDYGIEAPLGAHVTVSLEAQGEGLVYNWYRKDPGETEFTYDPTCTDNSYELVVEQWGIQVYCIVTDSQGNQAFSDCTCMVQPIPPVGIAEQPEDVTVPYGEAATVFPSCAHWTSACTFTWYEKDPGAAEFTVSSWTEQNYSVIMDERVDGRQVYYVVTDDRGNQAVSDIVTLTMEAGTAPDPVDYESPFLGLWKLEKLTQGEDVAEGEDAPYWVLVLNAGGSALVDDGETIAETSWQAREKSALMGNAVLTIKEENGQTNLEVKYSDGTRMRLVSYEGELSLRPVSPEELIGCWQSQQGVTLECWQSGAASTRDEEGAGSLHLWQEQNGAACILTGTWSASQAYINGDGALSWNGQLFQRTGDASAYQSGERLSAEDIQRVQKFYMGLASGDAVLPEGAMDCANADEFVRLIIAQP